MAETRKHRHYCRVCGERKSRSNFTGRGVAYNVCMECAALPLSERNEMERMTETARLNAKLRLRRDEWALLEKYSKSKTYPRLRSFAAGVLEYKLLMRELHRPSVDETEYNDLDNERKDELRELLLHDIALCFEKSDDGPTVRQLKRIEKDIFNCYLTNYHLRIIPDRHWGEQVHKALMAVADDFKEQTACPDHVPI